MKTSSISRAASALISADWYTRVNSATIAFSSAESATGGRWSPPAGWRWC
jgi:hypothetical protein